jgi:hypothetical protein
LACIENSNLIARKKIVAGNELQQRQFFDEDEESLSGWICRNPPPATAAAHQTGSSLVSISNSY